MLCTYSVSLQSDFEDNPEEGGGGAGPVQFQLDLGDGLTLTNLTEEWFGSSRKPRRIRPSNVRSTPLQKCIILKHVGCPTNNALLINLQRNSDAEILSLSTD